LGEVRNYAGRVGFRRQLFKEKLGRRKKENTWVLVGKEKERTNGSTK